MIRGTLIKTLVVGILLVSVKVSALDQTTPVTTEISIDQVAQMIRQHGSWEILDAKPKQSGKTKWYRFKLLSNKGKVRVINIDPKNPNLLPLSQ